MEFLGFQDKAKVLCLARQKQKLQINDDDDEQQVQPRDPEAVTRVPALQEETLVKKKYRTFSTVLRIKQSQMELQLLRTSIDICRKRCK